MSEWTGKIIACDRCGKECRLKLLGERELDGGFAHVQNFEKMPETWKYRYEIGYLCPKCNAEYQSLTAIFMNDAGKHDEEGDDDGQGDDDWTTRACIEMGR